MTFPMKTPTDHIIWDARKSFPIDGLYTKEEAHKLAQDLNLFVLRNTMPCFADMGVVPTGPFYPRCVCE